MKMTPTHSPLLHRKVALLAVTAVTVFGFAIHDTQAQALATKSSEDFNFLYEGNVLPNLITPAAENYVLRAGTTGGANSASVAGGILTTSSPASSFLYYEARVANYLDVIDLTAGFTAEIRLRVNTGRTFGGIQTGFASDTTVGAGEARLEISDTDTTFTGTGIVDTADNDDAFHTFRLIKLPSTPTAAGKFSLYRDGALIFDDVAGFNPTVAPPNRLFFGAYSSLFNSAGQVDYFRYDTTGAFAPVPEPATFGLVGVALALALVARRRRKA